MHADLLEALIKVLETGDFNKQHLSILLKDFSSKNNLKFPKFMKSLRAKLSGLPEGPGVAEMMEILGRKSTIQRIRKRVAIDKQDESKVEEKKRSDVK